MNVVCTNTDKGNGKICVLLVDFKMIGENLLPVFYRCVSTVDMTNQVELCQDSIMNGECKC